MVSEPLEPRANPDLIGQDRAQATLVSAWRAGRLPHAWLLFGPPGVGKATLAYRFARALLAGPSAVDDGLALAADHPVFRQVASGAHPDLRVIEPARDAKTGRMKAEIAVDTVRAATAALHATAAMGGHKVVIVDAAEQLNRNAANALLKPLEEPPPGTILLLVSHRLSRVIPTVRSRCAKLRLPALADDLVGELLAVHASTLGVEERIALARLARGSPGRALDLSAAGALDLYRRLTEALGAEPPDHLALHELAADLTRLAEGRGLGAALGLVQELLARSLATVTDRRRPALFADEVAALERLADRRPLARWARLWEKIARVSARAESVNLDRFQVLLHILSLLAPAAGEADERALGGAPLGGHHVLG